MSLVITDDFAAKRKAPTSVTETMTLKNNYYIVKRNEQYHYFRITIQPCIEGSQILRFDKHPPVIAEGIVVIEKKMYMVTIPDLLRGVIRKSRELVKVKNGTKRIAATIEPVQSNGPSTIPISGIESAVQHPNESAVSEEDECKLLEQADLCWNEQVDSLLHTLHTEEGSYYEISDVVQSRPDNEVSTVQNT